MGFPLDSAVSAISDILSPLKTFSFTPGAALPLAGTDGTAPTFNRYRFDVRCLCGPFDKHAGLSSAHHAVRALFSISPASSNRLTARMIVRSLRQVIAASAFTPGHALFS